MFNPFFFTISPSLCLSSILQDSLIKHTILNVHSLKAVNPHTIRIVVDVPEEYDHHKGYLEVYYTDRDSDDISTWDVQRVVAHGCGEIDAPTSQFEVSRLKPYNVYRIK